MPERFFCATDYPIALDSPDHLVPLATANDNSINTQFNQRLVNMLHKPQISVLDMGCAGGGMVGSLIDMGHIAVGIQGSDYSKIRKRAAWGTHGDYLFTADATKPFKIHAGDYIPYLFDVVTAWEFFEHIREDDLPGVLDNIVRHLAPGGWLICTIADKGIKRNGVYYHQTIKDHAWWLKLFERRGFTRIDKWNLYFNGYWVRNGPIKLAMKLNGRNYGSKDS